MAQATLKQLFSLLVSGARANFAPEFKLSNGQLLTAAGIRTSIMTQIQVQLGLESKAERAYRDHVGRFLLKSPDLLKRLEDAAPYFMGDEREGGRLAGNISDLIVLGNFIGQEPEFSAQWIASVIEGAERKLVVLGSSGDLMDLDATVASKPVAEALRNLRRWAEGVGAMRNTTSTAAVIPVVETGTEIPVIDEAVATVAPSPTAPAEKSVPVVTLTGSEANLLASIDSIQL
ncbi:MAG: hypothetical protein HYW77_03485 [Parcubacteria group bacterium]|nr:hypothetical protein [Parcubacteria group bacterium]